MSNLYTNFINEYNLGNIDPVTDAVVVVPVLNTYIFNATDSQLTDIGANVAGNAALIGGTKDINPSSVFKTTDRRSTFGGIPLTGTINAVIMYKQSTEELISYHTTLNEVPLGLTIQLDFIYNTGGFFQISPVEVFPTKLVPYRAIEVAYPRVGTMRS